VVCGIAWQVSGIAQKELLTWSIRPQNRVGLFLKKGGAELLVSRMKKI
jgi:hypothetical protein